MSKLKPLFSKKIWFSLKSKRGHEEKMKHYLGNHKMVLDAVVFLETSNKTKKQTKNLWPGVIFVKTIAISGGLDRELRDFIINAPHFARFFSYKKDYKADPVLMSEKEIDKMIKKIQSTDKPKIGKFSPDQINFQINDFVVVLTGVFRGYEGEAIEIDYDTGIVTLNVEFFGRITPIQIGFTECKKIVG